MLKLKYYEPKDKNYLSILIKFLTDDKKYDYKGVHFNKLSCRIAVVCDVADMDMDGEGREYYKDHKTKLNKIRNHNNWTELSIITLDEYKRPIQGEYDPDKEKVILEAQKYESAYQKVQELLQPNEDNDTRKDIK